MAKENVFLLPIFVIASLSSLSHGLSINGIQINTIEVQGVLLCTLNGSLNAPPVSGQTVFLRCDGQSTNLAEAITNSAGEFSLEVTQDTLLDLFEPSTCPITVNLPVATCSVFPLESSHFGRSRSRLVSIIRRNARNIASYTTGPFIYSL